MSQVNEFLSDNWFKIYPLIATIVFIIVSQDFSKRGFKKIFFLSFLIIFFLMCVLFGGYVYGIIQIFSVLIGCLYFSNLKKR